MNLLPERVLIDWQCVYITREKVEAELILKTVSEVARRN